MAEPISCNFARAAIHHFTTKHMTRTHKLPRGSYRKVIHEYNQHFADAPNLQTIYTVASNKFLPITRIFGKKWHPDGAKQVFITTFAPTSWVSIDTLEKSKHTLRACKVCEEKHEALNQSFPVASHSRKIAKCPQITLHPSDLSSPAQFGSKLLEQANSVSQSHFQKPVQQVL